VTAAPSGAFCANPFAKTLADFEGLSNINVKAETIQQRAMWRVPFQKRRCIVPADGFYEWQKIDAKTKKPYFYLLNNGNPFGLAGLWDAWKGPEQQRIVALIRSNYHGA
jgi:putative SOS response-associated peptidase YedK